MQSAAARSTERDAAARSAEVAELEQLSPVELMKRWRRLAEQVERLSRRQMLELLTETASRHPELREPFASVRGFLAVEGERETIARKIGGGPARIVDLETLTDNSLRQARIAGEAIARIWQEEVLPSSEVAKALGAKPANREKVNALRKRSQLLGLPRDDGRRYLYPAFQLDLDRREIYPEVRRVNEILDAAGDPWGVGSWWVSRNAYLESDARPMDLVATGQARAVVEAAKALVEPLG